MVWSRAALTRQAGSIKNMGTLLIGSYVLLIMEISRIRPTIRDLEKAHMKFEKIEPRALFYRTSIELVDLAIKGNTKLELAEAIAVLLQTWNVSYYRFRPFNEEHFSNIQGLLENNQHIINELRQRNIESFCDEDTKLVKDTFNNFERVLEKTGAAKCLHLLAPDFFPLWDTEIAKAYELGKGCEAERYCFFMEITRDQVKSLGGDNAAGRNLLKALDEYNYCEYTLPMLEKKREKRKLEREAEALTKAMKKRN
jgi:hypothetical protein